MTQSVAEIRDVLSGRPGGVNRLIRRYGKAVVDYCTALIPDRKAPFDRMVEDVLVDILAQARAAARASSDDEVFEFAIEAALRTIRSRYREVLDEGPQPGRATQSYQVNEVLDRTGMSKQDLVAGISEGRIRAIRANDSMKVVGDDVPGLGSRVHFLAYQIGAAERELLCLHYRLGFSPATIARWAGESPAHIEALINTASDKLAARIRQGHSAPAAPPPEEAKMRRYIDGRMDPDETSQFERRLVKDTTAQKRLDDLRSQSQTIKDLFDSPEYDYSAVSVNVRARNPHHALSLPPGAALWIQVVGLAAMMLMFHRVGAYIAPPEVRATAVVGDVQMPPAGRVRVGESVTTGPGAQALLQLDGSNRVLLAERSRVELQPPREGARQVMRLHQGEAWGRFTSAGHAFIMGVADGQELGGDSGAEFHVAVNESVEHLLPENTEPERRRLLASGFSPAPEGLLCNQPMRLWAGFRFGTDDTGGLAEGDVVLSADGAAATSPEWLADLAGAMRTGGSLTLLVQRDTQRRDVPVTRLEPETTCVIRVFHGAVMVETTHGRFAVNRGQWALLDATSAPMIGRRGWEDFRALRISAAERFKQYLHWLDTEGYPLRSENSVLPVDRGLRELAARLEKLRGDEVRRHAPAEIVEFERRMETIIADAKERIAQGQPRAPEGGNLGDEELVAAGEEILGAIGHWRRQSGTGIYTTLGDAAKTLHGDITRSRTELAERDARIGRASSLFKRIDELKQAVALQDTELARLDASEFHDEDGSKRAEFDARIAEYDRTVRLGAQAASRLDLTKITLNDLEARIDEQRRKLPDLRRNVQDSESAKDEIEEGLKANPYSPEALKAASRAVEEATATVNAAQAAEQEADSTQKAALAALSEAHLQLDQAEKAARPFRLSLRQAQDELADAVTARAAERKRVDEQQAEVNGLQQRLEGMEADDPDRADVEQQLQQARQALQAHEAKLKQAQATADAANKAVTAAETAAAVVEARVEAASGARDAAQKAADNAVKEWTERSRQLAASREALASAEAALALQQQARTERALLQTRLAEAVETLGVARDALAQVEKQIEELDAAAEPKRKEFRRELEIVQAGEKAREQLEAARRERDRYQAVSDEIKRRTADRAALQDELDGVSNADDVRNYDNLVNEHSRLHRAVRALEYTRTLALAEDDSFGHKQKAAQDRFREAASETAAEALALLDTYCPPYDGKAWQELAQREAFEELRRAVLTSMWSLYYDSSLEGSDATDSECYYVLVQSSAPGEAFNRLDATWRKYLGQALGRETYEKIASLSADDLKPKE